MINANFVKFFKFHVQKQQFFFYKSVGNAVIISNCICNVVSGTYWFFDTFYDIHTKLHKTAKAISINKINKIVINNKFINIQPWTLLLYNFFKIHYTILYCLYKKKIEGQQWKKNNISKYTIIQAIVIYQYIMCVYIYI